MKRRPAVANEPSRAERLIAWYEAGHRDLPWRAARGPYPIWISEIMLQQTRAAAAIPYYERFLERFPTVQSLAESAEEDVLTLWAGLGYYARARNLRRAARQIVETGFPREYEAWRALPGIGDYTAAAIASIAFDLPHAVVDGNVLRVVARMENDAADIGAARTRERFRAIAQSWLDARRPAAFNQAMMELGATICLPKNPMCAACPLSAGCRARAEGTAAQLPVKLRRAIPVKLEDTLLIVRRGGRILLHQRDADASRMAGFWDLPGLGDLPHARVARQLGEIRHTITHHHYRFVLAAATARVPKAGFRWFRVCEMTAIPLSTTARKALRTVGLLACRAPNGIS